MENKSNIKMEVEIKKLRENAIIPTYGSDNSAGADLYAAIDKPIYIQPYHNIKIGTGLAITPPHGYYGAIVPRSGMATKRGLRPANTPGTCDEDYTGEYIVALYNDSDTPQKIEPGDRIAQLIFLPYIIADWKIVDELKTTDRGDGGFGSTGTK